MTLNLSSQQRSSPHVPVAQTSFVLAAEAASVSWSLSEKKLRIKSSLRVLKVLKTKERSAPERLIHNNLCPLTTQKEQLKYSSCLPREHCLRNYPLNTDGTG